MEAAALSAACPRSACIMSWCAVTYTVQGESNDCLACFCWPLWEPYSDIWQHRLLSCGFNQCMPVCSDTAVCRHRICALHTCLACACLPWCVVLCRVLTDLHRHLQGVCEAGAVECCSMRLCPYAFKDCLKQTRHCGCCCLLAACPLLALDVSSDTSTDMCEVTHPLEGLLGLLLLASSGTLWQHTAAQTLLPCGYPFNVLSFLLFLRLR